VVTQTRILLIALASAAIIATPSPAQVITGDVVDTSTEREAPQALGTEPIRPPEAKPEPFGSNIFTGGFTAEREDGLNPDYIIAQGDRITLRIWGATSLEQVVTVDAQGNVFVPEVGPIRLEGVRNAELSERIQGAVSRVFTQNINVYANLEGTAPVIVYVTGYVVNPGSYAGVASDTLLYYVDRAGGIDRERGSYRDVRILRDGQLIAQADLYRFLLDGELPRIQFRDGDTILVGRRGATISADGAVRNGYTFEVGRSGISGEELIHLARPLADASHATLLGVRGEKPLSLYLTLAALAKMRLADGDHLLFEADVRNETMLVRVEGSHLGASRFAVPIDTTLGEMLDYIEVDPALASIDSISLKRRSIAMRQKAALENALRQLETTVLGASSQTDEEAKIRVQEAALITEFVERARTVEPEGVLVVERNGVISDVLLQPDDIITIPERTEVVLVSGEVMVPQAVVHMPDASLKDYILRVGGYTERANTERFLVVRRNGEVVPTTNIPIRPGDEILVLPKVPVKNLQLAKTITEMIFQIAVPVIAAFR
jgi:protein involved in polysaccharide export with SLBB domain